MDVLSKNDERLLRKDRGLFVRQKRIEAALERIKEQRKELHAHLDPSFSDDRRTLAIDGYSLRRDAYSTPSYQVAEALRRGSDALRELVRQAAEAMMAAGFGKVTSGHRYVGKLEVPGK
ncbi:MAG: hypothetical protein ACYCW6_00275 [Candidatus Xenobia bacterium]